MKLTFGSLSQEWSQILAITIGSLLTLNLGIFLAWTSPTTAILLKENNEVGLVMTPEEASYLTVLPPISLILFAIPISKLADWKGRRFATQFGAVPYIIAWILIAVGNSTWILYAARIISGVGDTSSLVVVTMYIGEVAVPKVRGRWGNLIVLSMLFGILLMNYVGGSVDMRTTVYILIPIPIACFLLLSFMPESPYYLIMKNRDEDAKAALRWLRRTEHVDEEFASISEGVRKQLEEAGTYMDIITVRSNFRSMSAAIITRLVQQFSGFSAFVAYNQRIFELADSGLSAKTATLICCSILLIFSIIASLMVDKFGRRKTFFSSAFSTITILLIMAVYLYINNNTDIDLSAIRWFPIACLSLLLAVFSLGLSVVPTLISGELFSASIKSKAMAIANIVFAMCVAGTSKIFQLLTSKFGLYSSFLFFGVACLFFSVICFFVMPETKGKTLNEIQEELKGKKKLNVVAKPNCNDDGNKDEHVC